MDGRNTRGRRRILITRAEGVAGGTSCGCNCRWEGYHSGGRWKEECGAGYGDFPDGAAGGLGVDADAKGVVGTEGTGGTVSLTEVTVTVENSDGLVTTPMMGTPSGKGEVGERNGEKGTASWSVAKTVRGSGLAMGVVILHALYANT